MAEVIAACSGGAALTGWALHLGMSAKLIGLLCALPVVAQVLQLGGAVLTARFGHRRTALVAIALSRQAFLPLALLPFLPLQAGGRQALLLAVAGLHHALGLVANNAWGSWMGELVPGSLRGRYFGRRTAFATVAGGACALLAGLALDGGQQRGAAGVVLQALAAVASAAGLASVLLMSRQHARPARREPVGWILHALARPLADGPARRVVAYAVVWNGACGLSAPFFGLYLLRDLGSGFAVFAAQGAGLAAAKIASASAWGRWVDRVGARRVLVLCTAGLALSPLAWIVSAPGRLWPLALETALGGILLGGQSVASFALPLSVAPARERPFYLAVVAAAGGAAFALTSAAGGAVAEAAQGRGGSPLPLLLVGSAALRVGAIGAALFLPAPRAAVVPPAAVVGAPEVLEALERAA
ncbi:MAG TPA: MFS transporter [Anaeromyxobacteraceae bacterium]